MSPDWLQQLAPAHAPPPPGGWPPAPGWWALAALGALSIVLAWRHRRAPQRRLRRQALRELAALGRAPVDDPGLARALEDLLRRYAVHRFGRERVAALCGEAWLAFVADHGGEDWRGDAGRALLHCAYGGRAAADRGRWLAGARGFLRRAR